MISFRARRRQVVRQERRDQIRRDIREQLDQLARCDAGDPEALRQAAAGGCALMAVCQEPAEMDYPEPVEPVEPDEGPWHAQRPDESERAYRRRIGRPDLAERRAARLLARGYWRIDRPLPGPIREALYAVVLSPRELRRMLAAVWERAERGDYRPREHVPAWTLGRRELADLAPWSCLSDGWLEVCPAHGPPVAVAALEAPVISP